MSLILLLSIIIRLLALGMAVVLWRRLRDWRAVFLAAMVGLMALRQTLTLLKGLATPILLDVEAHVEELPGLAVSIFALLAVIFLGRMIRERENITKALSEREEEVRLLFDSTVEAIYRIDLDGNCTFCNRACVEILGYQNSRDLLGQHMHTLIHYRRPDGTPYPVDECPIYQAFKKSEGTHVDDEVLWCADGSSFPAEYWSYPIWRESRVVGAVVTFLNITKRKQAEERLRESEQRFKDYAEAASDRLWEMDENLRFTVVLDRFGTQAVPSPEECLGKTRWELHGADCENDEKWSLHRADLEARKPIREFRYVTADEEGRRNYWNVNGKPVFDKTGVFKGYRGTARNETAEVEAEQRAAEAHEQLINAIESMSEGFGLYDADDRLVLCNGKFRELYDVSADLLVPGVRFEDHIRASAERGQWVDAVGREEEWVKERLEQHRNPKGSYEQQLGSGRWLLVSEHKTREGGIVGVRADITEQKKAQQALRERDTRLHELQAVLIHVSRLSEMGHLASALAHELNQPLTAIMNYVQASRRVMEAGGGCASDRVYEMMDKAVDQVDRAGAIIHRLRAFVEKGETQRFEEDINQVVEEASALAFIGSGEKGVTVGLELSPGLPPVLIDKVQIQQVLLNLVRNSIEAMAESESRQVTITTSQAETKSIEVAIRDTGPGLAEEVLDRLFEPFVTTRAEGMGIGLSISRSIVEAHGGRLGATPNPGGGTTFRFTLPMMPPVDGNHDE